MRLWTIHPKYLDTKGLVALWRESLLAQAVLAGRTRGYTSHPQLARFKACPDPVGAIGGFLSGVLAEATSRGHSFDIGKIQRVNNEIRLATTTGQVEYEFSHLLKKLAVRDPTRHQNVLQIKRIEVNFIFIVESGGVEVWEKTIENT